MSGIASGDRSCQALTTGDIGEGEIGVGDIGVSWSRPGQALISRVWLNWLKRRCHIKLHHDRLKRDLQTALRSIPKDYSVDAYVDRILEVISWRCARLDRLGESVLMVGPYRIGKSTIAGTISRKGQHVHVPIDILSKACESWPDPSQRDALLNVVICTILTRLRGVVLEGGVVLSFSDMAVLSGYANIIFLGDVSDYHSRADCIVRYRRSSWCWTSVSLSDECVGGMAEKIIQSSRNLQSLSRELGVPFIGLRGSHSEADIRHASELIWARVNGI